MIENLVSIIIPLYNSEKYILETINSVYNQSYKNYELIVVNDGSTDQSVSLISNTFKDLSIYSKSNSGVSDSRNFGLNCAQGEYVIFLDSDDVWNENFLKSSLQTIKSNLEFQATYSFCEIIDENSKLTGEIKKGVDNFNLEDLLNWNNNYLTFPSGVLFKKEVFTTLKSYDVNISNNADNELLQRFLYKGFSIKLINEVLWRYRIHSKNMSSNITKMEKETLYVFNKAKKNGYFSTNNKMRIAKSSMYFVLAGCFYKNEKNYFKTFRYIVLSFIFDFSGTLRKIKNK